MNSGLYTKRQYPCGCKAEGPGDIPAYCSEHGVPPDGPLSNTPPPRVVDQGPKAGDTLATPLRPKGALKDRINAPPVDRTKRELTDGSPVPSDYSHTNIRADGMQDGYIVLTAEERAKGFVRPVRRSYLHKPCGTVTTMGLALAETYARDPEFYNGTFCCGCRQHFPLDQFVWDGTDEIVGA